MNKRKKIVLTLLSFGIIALGVVLGTMCRVKREIGLV